MDSREARPGATERVFVGREREMEALRAGLERRGPARDRFFLVSGEPGIGKTRLCEEIAAVARGGGAQVLVGRCWEAGSAPDYWPWRQVLRAHVSTTDAADLARDLGGGAALVAQLVPEIAGRLGKSTRDAAASVFVTEPARFALFDSIAQYLESAARGRPMLLVLDDLHAADPASLHLLRFVVRSLHDAALMIAVTYRDPETYGQPEVAALVAELAREGQSLPLVGLGEPDVTRLLEATAGATPQPELVRSLHRRAGGNPFYLDALLRSPEVAGRLQLADGEGAAHVLPNAVRESVRRRVERLATPCIEALQVASAIGLEFDLGAVAHVCGTEVETMRTLFEEAVAAGLLHPAAETRGGLRFTHGLVRETLHDDLPPARRLALQPRADAACSLEPPRPRPLRAAGCFLLEGEYWTIEFEGATVRLKDCIGLRCIAHLLRHQNVRLHARDLARVGRHALRGPTRSSADERARLAVTQRVKAALKRIAAVHPALGRHLKRSIKTGTFCAYVPNPEQPISWLL